VNRLERSNVEYSLVVRRYAPFRSFGGGGEGDDRGYSTDMDATSRIGSVARFKPGTALVHTHAFTSSSSWVGPWALIKRYNVWEIGHHSSDVSVSVSGVLARGNRVAFTMHSEGSAPVKDIALGMVPGVARGIDRASKFIRPHARRPQGVPDIDTFVDFRGTFRERSALFEGLVRGDGFPNAEVFVVDARGRAVGLVDYRTGSCWAGPWYRLFSAHAKNRLAEFRVEVDLEPDGSFGSNRTGSPVIVQEE
jgi:hypothetical protein